MADDGPASDELTLSPHEITLLSLFEDSATELTLADITDSGKLQASQARSTIERLKMKSGLEQTGEEIKTMVSLNDAGQDAAKNKIAELRLWATVEEQGSVPIKALQQRDDLDKASAGAAFGALKKAKVFAIDKGQVSLAPNADRSDLDARQAFVASLSGQNGAAVLANSLDAQQQAWLKDKRLKSLFKVKDVKIRRYKLTAEGLAMKAVAVAQADQLSRLTPDMLKDESWRGKTFRRYAIGLPPKLNAGSRNAYRAFLDKTRRSLIGLGFEEMRGSLVDNEFWNMDALFLPQFHPAREIHDVYFVDEPTHAKEVKEPFLTEVARAHEGDASCGSMGWKYDFDKERTKRLVLRSQGTALSSRQLGKGPREPGKYFAMARCFRYDTVDATHAPDFFQVEGIVVSEQTSFQHLLGLLRLFAHEMAGAKDVRFVPAYFPFTEPSVEVHMRHPTLGWMELGGAGIFRPEVSESLGVDVPVIAWGLGLDRMAMVALGIKDIRHLFTNNLPHGLADARTY